MKTAFMGIGIVLIIAGIISIIFISASMKQEAQWAKKTKPSTYNDLINKADGERVIVIGIVSQSNFSDFRDMVAYDLYEYGSIRKGVKRSKQIDEWNLKGKKRPDFFVEVGRGTVEITGGKYFIENPISIQDRKELVYIPFKGGTKKYVGIRKGDQVVVVGHLIKGTPIQIKAERVFRGNLNEYIRHKERGKTGAVILGSILFVVGIVMVIVALFIIKWATKNKISR